MTRKGIVSVSNELLLKFLDFSGGKIRDVKFDGFAQSVQILIEHPDMPEVADGDAIPQISPEYIMKHDAFGHELAIRISP